MQRQWFLTGGTKHRNREYEAPTFLGIAYTPWKF